MNGSLALAFVTLRSRRAALNELEGHRQNIGANFALQSAWKIVCLFWLGLHVPRKGGEPTMNLKKRIAAVLLALALAPAYVIAQDMEFKGTIVSKEEKSIKVKTKEGEKVLAIGSKTKGVENAKEGEKVTIKYTEKDGKMRASEIMPR